MKFSMNWLSRYTPLPMNDKAKLNEIIDRIALQIVDVDERWFIEKDGKIIDAIIDIDNKIITNRPYAFGHRGLAREVAVMLNQEYTGKNYPTLRTASPAILPVSVEVKDPDLCPRFTAISIKGVKIGPSPDFLKYAVESIGQRSINNLVDITNMIMFDTAQPVHAYDYNKVKDGKIIIRRATPSEKVTTLDGVERVLNTDNLLITDPEKSVGLGGIMGAGNSEIDENTTDILLEIASFNPQNIRVSAKNLKHRTDAVTRFEKGVDPTNIPNVMAFMVDLILEVCGGTVASEYIDINNLALSPIRSTPLEMKFNPERVDKLLGFKTGEELMKRVFDGFDISYEIKSNSDWTLQIPPYRTDIKEAADLVEDIGRMYGYQNIPNIIPVNQLLAPKKSPKLKAQEKIRQSLIASGLDETITFPFISQKDCDQFSLSDSIKIVNPLSEEYEYLRPTLLPSLTKVIAHNSKFFDNVGIFEIARKFVKKQEQTVAYNVDHGESLQPKEIETVTALYYSKQDKEQSIFVLKGALENIFETVKLPDYKIDPEGNIFVKNNLVGKIGLIDLSTLDKYEIASSVSYVELELENIYKYFDETTIFAEYSRFQGTKLEYSMFVPSTMPAQEVLDLLPSHPWITRSEITDIYKNPKELERKSISIKIYIQKIDANINENEIYELGVLIENNLKKNTSIEIRGGGVTKPKNYDTTKSTDTTETKPVIAGEIMSIEKHPNADRLVICQVNVGTETVQIVTGASNMQVGDIVPTALPGTAVPGLKDENGNPVVMKLAKLRGVESYGMILAGDELGTSNDHSGIVILDRTKYKPGQSI